MHEAGIAFEEKPLRFDSFEPGSRFKQAIGQVSPVGKVPVLVDDGLAVWDTLAIAEYLAEQYPALNLWPTDRSARARARSVCAEMHSGFTALRTHWPMNVEASLPDVGQRVWAERSDVRGDVQRVCNIWTGLLEQHGGPLLFGSFGIADAYFAPVCMRFRTYAAPLPDAAAAYVQRVLALPSVQRWTAGALGERDFLPFEEPYRGHRP